MPRENNKAVIISISVERDGRMYHHNHIHCLLMHGGLYTPCPSYREVCKVSDEDFEDCFDATGCFKLDGWIIGGKVRVGCHALPVLTNQHVEVLVDCKAGIKLIIAQSNRREIWKSLEKKQSHNKKMVRYGRKARKLQNRIKALRAKKMAVKDEEKMMEALKQEFMSSEESDSEDDTLLVTKPIPWLSEEYKKAMEKLDKKYQRDLNAQGKKLRSKRVVSRPSERPCPNKTTQLAWVFAEN